MDRPVGSAFIIPVILVTLIGAVLAASTVAQLNFSFRPGASITLNPLEYTQNLTLYSGETGSINYTDIFTLDIQNPPAIITLSTQATNIPLIFEMLRLTLFFNSTTVILDGLEDQSVSLTLSEGYYRISATLAYTVLTTAGSPPVASWIITIS